MIRLTGAKKLVAVLASGADELDFFAAYSDKTDSAYTGASASSESDGTTPVDVVAAPASGVVRDIDGVTIHNKGAGAVVVTVSVNDGGTLTGLVEVSLDPQSSAFYTHGAGWRAIDSFAQTLISGTTGGGDVSLADGNYGDVTVSGSGTVITINNGSVSFAKMQTVSTNVLLGNDGSGTAVEEIPCTAAGRALLDDADAAAQRTTLGLGTLATQSGTFSGTSSGTNTGDQNLFPSIAVSGQTTVTANSATTTLNLVAGSNVTITTDNTAKSVTIAAAGSGGVTDGDKGDITVSSSGATWTIDANVVSDAKLRQSAGLSVVGRGANTTGNVADITAGTDGHVLRRSGTTLAFGLIGAAGIDDDAVGDAELRNSAALSVIGRAANSTGDPADIAAGTDGHVLRRSGTTLGFGQLAIGAHADNVITAAKLAAAATSRVFGRKTASAGLGEEVTLSELLDFIGSAAQGDVLYRGSSAWTRLAAGTSGHYLQTQGAGANPQWAAAGGGSSVAYIYLRDQQTANTAGGTFTSGSFVTRVLNTEVIDSGNNCTLSSNQFALAAGTYNILARAPGRNCNTHKAKLRNITDSTDTIVGASAKISSGAGDQSDAWVMGQFTIAGTKTFELQHRCQTTSTTDGLGEQSNFGVVEVYAEVWLEKVA